MDTSATSPPKVLHLDNIQDAVVADAFRALLRILIDMQALLAKTINYNEIILSSQATQPTATEGQFILWVDTTGTPGTPKAHIVTLQGGVAYSFSSKELY